jgi:hypothetical protein
LYQSFARLDPAELAALPAAGEAFAIEVYCLGLMRGDFSLDQLPLMLAELDRLRRELPTLRSLEPATLATAADQAASFDRFPYVFEPRATCKVTAVVGDFRLAADWAGFAALAREAEGEGRRPMLVAGSCDCGSASFAGPAVPRMTDGGIEPSRIHGQPVLATSSLGKSDAVVEAVLRRVDLAPGTELILADCTWCRANAGLAAGWRADRRVDLAAGGELDSFTS